MEASEHWLYSHWRPQIAWQYYAVCLFDFIIFPIMSGVYQASLKLPLTEWHPITLQGGGLYHVSMGAIIAVTSYGRSQEKIATINANGTEDT